MTNHSFQMRKDLPGGSRGLAGLSHTSLMDKTAERRKHFKTPPVDSVRSQEARRIQVYPEDLRVVVSG